MIYISSAAVNSSSIEDSVNKLVGIGFRNIELSGGTRYSDNILKKLKDLKNKFSLNYLIHNYFPPPQQDLVINIASQDERTRLESINFVKGSIKLAQDLKIDCYTLHSGYAREFRPSKKNDYFISDSHPGISPELASTFMFKSLSTIREYARERGVRIGLENLFPTEKAPNDSLLCIPADIIQFLDQFDKEENIGLLLDLGHLLISANYFGFSKDDFIDTLCTQYFHKVFGIHLSGNDGRKDYHTLLSPNCWQLRTARRFNLEKTPITVECRGFNTKDLLNQYTMVSNILEKEA